MSITTDEETLRELADNANRINKENYRYYQTHLAEIQQRYGGEIVVIHDKEIIASRDFTGNLEDLSEFFDHLAEEYGDPVADAAYITHVPDPDRKLML